MLNSIHETNRSRINGEKDWKALYKLMNNAAYEKAIQNLRNRMDVKLARNKRDYLKLIKMDI